MNDKDRYQIDEKTLSALRVQEDAVRIIADKLGVQEMGPADHIRTKHEIKTYVESCEKISAEKLLKQAHARREQAQTVSHRQSLQQNRSITSE